MRLLTQTFLDHAPVAAARALLEKEQVALRQTAINLEKFPPLTTCENSSELPPLEAWASHWQSTFRHLLVVGMGGSSLGGRLLVDFTRYSHGLPLEITFLDNVDASLAPLLAKAPLKETAVLVVSKSGGTLEVLTATLLLLQEFKKAGLPAAKHFYGLTEKGHASRLRQILAAEGAPCLPHGADIGGRFSVFSGPGLLPALTAGMDVVALRRGALQVWREFLKNPIEAEASLGAAMAVAMAETAPVYTMMPYGNSLTTLGPWFSQLWAESLGKNGTGSTPLAALGARDQHSLLQLFMEGPRHHFYTLVLPGEINGALAVTAETARRHGCADMVGLTPEALITAQGRATAQALAAGGRPVRLLTLETPGPEALGALLARLMIETMVAAALWRVNPLDQPGVEEAKKRTLSLLAGENGKTKTGT